MEAGKRVEARKVTKVARQEQIAASLRLKLEEGGCNTKDIRFIPVAALNGDNITEHADYPWYDGPTLLEALLEMRGIILTLFLLSPLLSLLLYCFLFF